MNEYVITFARSAGKELEALDAVVVRRIFPRIERLGKNQRPRGCRKLRHQENLWRIRVGDYRVIYSIFEERGVVDIVSVRHRSDAYR
jgi:mRNA interferase RelE/StbE